MTKGLLFWVLMLLWVVFGTWWNWPRWQSWAAPNLLLFILLLILGWDAFGPPIR